MQFGAGLGANLDKNGIRGRINYLSGLIIG